MIRCVNSQTGTFNDARTSRTTLRLHTQTALSEVRSLLGHLAGHGRPGPSLALQLLHGAELVHQPRLHPHAPHGDIAIPEAMHRITSRSSRSRTTASAGKQGGSTCQHIELVTTGALLMGQGLAFGDYR